MANVKKQTRYTVAAFDCDGRQIVRESVSTKVAATRTAKEFLRYSNVRTVDLDEVKYVDLTGPTITRFLKTGMRTGLAITNGVMRNIRF